MDVNTAMLVYLQDRYAEPEGDLTTLLARYLNTEDTAATATARFQLLIQEALAAGDEMLLHQITKILTDAQIKALPTTPVEIMVAQGADLITLPVVAMLVTDGFTANPYTNIDDISASFAFRWEVAGNPGTGLGFSVGDNAFFPDNLLTKDTVGRAFNVSGSSNQSPPTPESLANVGIDLTCNNQAAGDFTGGNAANTLTIAIVYYLFNLSTGQFV